MGGSLQLPRSSGTRWLSPNRPEALLCHERPQVAGACGRSPTTLTPVASTRVPFLWLCGPTGVGKSSVGYAFQQVYRSGIKVAYVDLDQVGLCYPSPADDRHNHRVKAQNFGVAWPTYRAVGARCLIAVGGVPSREIVMTYADKVPDTDLTLCRLRAKPEYLTERVFRRGLGRARQFRGLRHQSPSSCSPEQQRRPLRQARELDAADFADLYVDTDDYNVRQLAQHRTRARDTGKVAFMQPEAALACAAGRGRGGGWRRRCCRGRPGAGG